MRRTISLAVLFLVLAMVIPTLASGRPTADVRLAAHADLVRDGQSVVLSGRATCAEGFSVLEALAYATQGSVTTQSGGFGIACEGRWHPFTETATVLDGGPEMERATATVFLLVPDGGGMTADAGTPGRVRLR
jgi:hypothetical protein